MDCTFKDQNLNPLRATELYWLPYIPSIDLDLNSNFTDEDFERLLDIKPAEGSKIVSLTQAAVIFNHYYPLYMGASLGFLGVLEKLGYAIQVQPNEYRIQTAA